MSKYPTIDTPITIYTRMKPEDADALQRDLILRTALVTHVVVKPNGDLAITLSPERKRNE